MEIGKIDIKTQFTENEFKGSVYRKIRIENSLNGKSKPLFYSIENREIKVFPENGIRGKNQNPESSNLRQNEKKNIYRKTIMPGFRTRSMAEFYLGDFREKNNSIFENEKYRNWKLN